MGSERKGERGETDRQTDSGRREEGEGGERETVY